MQIGKASNQAHIGESINIEIDGKTYAAIAGNEINGSKVLVVKAPDGKRVAFSESAPYTTHSNSTIKKTRTKKNKETIYPIKIVAAVRNGGKTEIWVYGDSKPKKVYELPNANYITIYQLAIHNRGKTWEVFIKYFDNTIPVPIPSEYNGIGGLSPGYIESYGSTVIVFIASNGSVTVYGNESSPMPVNRYLNWNGGGYACTSPVRVWANQYTDIDGTTVFNDYSFSPNLLYLPWGNDFPLNSEIPTQYYLLDGIKSNIVLSTLVFSNNYTSCDFPSRDYIKNSLNPIAKDSDFRSQCVNGDLNSFLITARNGLILSQNTVEDYDVDLKITESPNITGYIDPVLPAYLNKHPIHSVYTENFQSAMIPIYFNGIYHTPPYVEQFNFRIELKRDRGNSPFLVSNNYYQFNILQTDKCYVPIPLVSKDSYELNSFNLKASNMVINNQLQLSYNNGSYGTPATTYSKVASLKLTEGIQDYTYFNVQKTAKYQFSSHVESGTDPPTVERRWTDCQIPYLYLKGNNSFILSQISINKVKDGVTSRFNIKEDYTFYQGDKIIPLTDLGDLKVEVYFQSAIYDILDTYFFDTLVGDIIYRVVEDADLSNSKTSAGNVSVEKYKITSDGQIVKQSTKKYPVQSLGLSSQADIWSASVFL